MPTVYRKELLALFDNVRRKFGQETGRTLQNTSVPEYYHELTERLNRFSPASRVTPRYLQKELGSRFFNTADLTLSPNVDVLNTLTAYYYGNVDAKYDDYYSLAGNEDDLIRHSVTRIEQIESATSENDIRKPEFPVDNPAYPASPHYPITYKRFKKLWIKDESFNPTGTHKDRMAWEIIRFYKRALQQHIDSPRRHHGVPRLSILSSGSAAVAIQYLLNQYTMPPLKVLVDASLTDGVLAALKRYGCEIYAADLEERRLTSADVLELTENVENGIDVTFPEFFGAVRFDFYDWLSFEILNQNPEYCIIPFGSGNLFENVLEINKAQLASSVTDRRFFGDASILQSCMFLGATCEMGKRDTVMDKLYTPFNTSRDFDMSPYVGYCNPQSGIIEVEESCAIAAMELAKRHNVTCEPSGIAGLALFLKIEDTFPADRKILIVNTGKLKEIPRAEIAEIESM